MVGKVGVGLRWAVGEVCGECSGAGRVGGGSHERSSGSNVGSRGSDMA